MEGRINGKYAIMKDAPPLPRKEDFVIDMGRSTRVSAAQTTIMPRPNEKVELPQGKVRPGDLMELTTRATHPKYPTPNKPTLLANVR